MADLKVWEQRIGSAVLLAALCFVSAGCGKPEVATSPPLDAIEQQLEVPRHESFLAQVAGSADQLSEFSTDGCSGGLSMAWEQLSDRYPRFRDDYGALPPWQACCIKHDRVYHSGGNRPESALFSFKLRRDADLALRACVIQTGSDLSDEMRRHYDLTDTELLALYETIGDLMYRAVRLGGIPCTEASWRWGYGWPKCGQVSGEG